MNTKELIHQFNAQTKAKGKSGNVFFEANKLIESYIGTQGAPQ